MFLLSYCDFGFYCFSVIRKSKFFPSSFFPSYRKKSKFERNFLLKTFFFLLHLFSFDVEVDTNSILLSRCLLDRIISLLGICTQICQVFAVYRYVERIISQAEGVKQTEIRVLEFFYFLIWIIESRNSYWVCVIMKFIFDSIY